MTLSLSLNSLKQPTLRFNSKAISNVHVMFCFCCEKSPRQGCSGWIKACSHCEMVVSKLVSFGHFSPVQWKCLLGEMMFSAENKMSGLSKWSNTEKTENSLRSYCDWLALACPSKLSNSSSLSIPASSLMSGVCRFTPSPILTLLLVS